LEPLQIQYYRSERLVAVEQSALRLSSIHKAALNGMTGHGADKAKVLEGDKVVAVINGYAIAPNQTTVQPLTEMGGSPKRGLAG